LKEFCCSRFNAVTEQKSVPVGLRDDYRKWLKYFLDFRVKYPPPDKKSEQVRIFIDKMWSRCADNDDLHALRVEQSYQRVEKPAGFLTVQ